ncbi:MAG TPA: S8 family serine peptidase [Candidatus Eisenbacteria bacterium]|nr:S8 family serine peptidase [Candidatus Eisenbacteria bacterium]
MRLLIGKARSVLAALRFALPCFLLSLAAAETRNAAASGADPLDAETVRLLEGDGRAAVWIYFTDKGEADPVAFARALRDAEFSLSPRSKARRAKLQGGTFVPQFEDVGVLPRYLKGVADAGAVIRRPSRWLNAVSAEVDLEGARRIARLPYVRKLEPVGTLVPQLADPGPPTHYGYLRTPNTALNTIAAHDSGYSAAGIVIGIFDTGFRKDHTFVSQLKRIAEWDFVDSNGETANQAGDPPGQWNHGTGCWSILGGYKPGTFVGPAYNASFVLAKTHDIDLSTNQTVDLWLAAAEWVDSIGVDLLSTSMVAAVPQSQLNGDTTPMALATNTLVRHGVVVVAAMGNFGPGATTMWTPSDCDSMISVSAVDSLNNIYIFASRGPTQDGRGKPDLVAQGRETAWADASCTTCLGYATGTSLATPLVAGAAALVMEAHPDWTAQEVRYALKVTADRASNPDSTTYGWGRPNAVKAIYDSPLGPPRYPKPFDLTAPANQGIVQGLPITFHWRRSVDLTPFDEVLYEFQLRELPSGTLVFTESTSDTFWQHTEPLQASTQYEWTVSATDLTFRTRLCREPARFTYQGLGPIAISAPAQVEASEGGSTSIIATASDPDAGRTLTITASGLPPGLSFEHTPSVSPATATLSGTLGPGDTAGSPYTVTWIATDGLGETDTTTTTVTVGVVTAVPVSSARAPRVVHFRNRPNPFQGSTRIEMQLEGSLAGAPLSVRIYDVHGRLVRTLLERSPWQSGTLTWDGLTAAGERAAAGVYQYRLEAGRIRHDRRLVLLK